MNRSQKIETSREFICSSCNKSFFGNKIPVDTEDVLLNWDDIQGYSCSSCQMTYCVACTNSQIMNTFRSSPCPQCQTSFRKADYIYEEQTGIFQAHALKKQVDADDGGGAEWYADSVLTLFNDKIRIISRWQTNIGQSEIIPLDKIIGVEVHGSVSDDTLGTLKFIPCSKGFLSRYFAKLPRVEFNRRQESRVRELAEKITLALKPSGTASHAPETTKKPGFHGGVSSDNDTSAGHTRNAVPSSQDLAVLEKLAALYKKGILTDEEFAAKKAQILDL